MFFFNPLPIYSPLIKSLGALARPIFKQPIWNSPEAKTWSQELKKSKKMNLQRLRKNYSKSNERCMLLQLPIPKSIFKFFYFSSKKSM